MDETETPSELAAEALAAITGLFQDEPVSPEQGRMARALPKQWRGQILEFLSEKKFRPFRLPKGGDHDGVLDQLTAGVDAPRRATLVSRLEDPALGEAYLTALARATASLRARWPSLSLDTPLGPRSMPPGKTEQMRSAALLAVVDEPSRILEEMRMGTLTSEQADLFRESFPALYAMLRQMIWAELAKQYRTPERYALPFSRELVVRRLVGLPPEVSLSKVDQPPAKQPTPEIKVDFKGWRSKAQELGSR